MIEAAVPDDPVSVRRRDEQGTVHFGVQVLASGQAGEVRIQHSSGVVELDRAAVAAVHRSTFDAARDGTGAAVDAWVIVPYQFVLQD